MSFFGAIKGELLPVNQQGSVDDSGNQVGVGDGI